MVRRKNSSVKPVVLAINTASGVESTTLFSGKKLVTEKEWHGNADESEKLLPNILEILKKARTSLHNLKHIIVVKGPGPFSAVRIGVTVANTLAFALKIPLYSIDSKSLWLLRAPNRNAILLLHAGGYFVHRSGGGLPEGIFSIENALKLRDNSLIFYGDITAAEMAGFKKLKKRHWYFIQEKDLKSFGEVISTVKSNMLKKEKVVTPLYWKPPHITYPKTYLSSEARTVITL